MSDVISGNGKLRFSVFRLLLFYNRKEIDDRQAIVILLGRFNTYDFISICDDFQNRMQSNDSTIIK